MLKIVKYLTMNIINKMLDTQIIAIVKESS